jgi:hypothetical protein
MNATSAGSSPLAFLAPDITEAILDGKQNPDLSLEKCAFEISLAWTAQRAALTQTTTLGDSTHG